MSYTNAIMYSRAMPHPDYSDHKGASDKPLFDESKNADNDIRITDEEDEEIIRI